MTYTIQTTDRESSLVETIRYKDWHSVDNYISQFEGHGLRIKVWNSQNNLVYDSVEGSNPRDVVQRTKRLSTDDVDQWVQDNSDSLKTILATKDPVTYFAVINDLRKSIEAMLD